MTAPTLTGLGPTVTFNENTVNATPQLLDSDVVFTDPDNDFNGGSLTVSGLLAEDSVSVLNVGNGAGQIGLSGANVTYGGITIGTLSGGTGNTLTISFNASATSAAIDALLQSLTYANSSDTPTSSRDLSINVTDSTGASLQPASGWDPSFSELTDTDNPFNGLNVGTDSNPTMVDIDGDNDLDLVVGQGNGTLLYFTKNNGSAGYTQQTGANNPFNGIDVGSYSAPTFVDLDGDDDLDLVVGEGNGTLRVFDNDDVGTGYTELTGASNPLIGVDVGSESNPIFVDLDGDNDLDLVVGEQLGTFRVYDNNDGNTGFTELTGVSNPFNGIDAGQTVAPSFADIDGDGDLDIVVGESTGTLLVYEKNNGSAGYTQLVGADNPFNGVDLGEYSTPFFADLDDDGDLDLIVGSASGALRTFENTAPKGQTLTVNVTAENDPISATGLPASISGNEDASFDVDLTGLGLSDPDGTGANIIVSISATAGRLNATSGSGVNVIGSGSDTVTLFGTIGSIEAFLQGVGSILYTGAQDAFGTNVASISFSANDTVEAVNLGTIQVNLSDVVDTQTGTAGQDYLAGDDGSDELYGLGGADNLTGGGGEDVIEGGDGDDVITGGAGADTLSGGANIDWVKYTTSSAGVTVNLTADINGFQSASGGDAEGDVLSGFENVRGSNHDDTLTGDSQGNRLYGMAGSDVINGGAGDDVIRGGADDDVITGGSGADKLWGQGGADVFVYNDASDTPNGGVDAIRGFTRGVDQIDLSAIQPIGGFTFIGTDAFTGGGAATIRYVVRDNKVIVRADVDGDGSMDMAIRMFGLTEIGADDFVL